MIDLVAVRATGSRPRVHGNGFIQLDLTEDTRLHVWHPSVPRQKVATQIHDHVFSFRSRCIVGRIINVVYKFIETDPLEPTAEFRVYTPRVRKGSDTTLHPTDTCGYVVPANTHMVMAGTCFDGNKYEMPKGWFHDSVAPDGIAATIINKLGPTQAEGGPPPRVLVPRGQVPDNKFNRYTVWPERTMWGTIEKVLKERNQ